MTTTPLVDTKLFVPRARQRLVPRPRLDLLGRTGDAKLTLVSAPAGFGKTTLLVSWLAADGAHRRTAWVSLEETERQAGVFWAYVLTALERAAPGTGGAGLALLQTEQIPIETVLATVLNELSVLPEDVDLVLDDYHLADGAEIQAGMTYLLDHLPPQVHLMISTRADPALPLARMRARGELAEVRAADLRFTAGEAASYLLDLNGLELDPADVSTLVSRTEGWIAALQLAAISLQDRDDSARFIAGFAGDDRYVVDFLLEEVLDRQRDEIRDFLLETSILDRLTAPLCDAVIGTTGSAAMLEALDRQNLFMVPLDDQRGWYRYHHLFADVLHARLLAERPGNVAELHSRASTWFDQSGDPLPAVRHALAAGDTDRAADLIELAIPALRRDRRESVICGWVEALPDDVLQHRPVLAIGLVGGLMAGNRFDGVEERLQDIERQLAHPDDRQVVVDRDELDRLPAAVEMFRAGLALMNGDAAGAISHADQTLERASEDDDLVRAAAAALSGLASWSTGDLAAAHRGYTIATDRLERAGHVSDVLGCSITLADIEMTQGRLRESERTFERALELAGRDSGPMRGVADMCVGLGVVARERDDLESAAAHLRRSHELGDDAGLPQNPYRWSVAMARLREAEGDLDAAGDLLDEAVRVYVGDYSPNVRPVPAQRARMYVLTGDLPAARKWSDVRGLSASDELTYLSEYEHLTLARIHLAEHRLEGSETALTAARELLDRLLAAAEAGGRTGTVIEALTLLGLAHQAQGDLDAAGDAVERALRLAEPEGFARVFLDEGPATRTLLLGVAENRADWPYLRRLLDRSPRPDAANAAPVPAAGQGLVDPLSQRELDVLRLLASDLDGPAIARELVVSLNTVRTHTKHIYAKLGVNSRRSAVSQAHQRGLLSGNR